MLKNKYRAVLGCMLLAGCSAMASKDVVIADFEGENRVLRKVDLYVNQGVAVDAEYYYVISSKSISKRRKRDDVEVAEWHADPADETSRYFSHMNSGVVLDGILYCTHSNKELNLNTIELWDVVGKKLEHIKTLKLEGTIQTHGYITWADKKPGDGSWWLCYAVYGKDNQETKLFKCRFDGKSFREEKQFRFPEEVARHWGKMSCSGGSWGPDGLLYTTGHDLAQAYLLRVDPETGGLRYVRTEKGMGFFGQGIAWDRSDRRPVLWGICKKGTRSVSATLVPGAGKGASVPGAPARSIL